MMNEIKLCKALIEQVVILTWAGNLNKPRFMAVINGNLDMVKFLISSGADYMLMDEK